MGFPLTPSVCSPQPGCGLKGRKPHKAAEPLHGAHRCFWFLSNLISALGQTPTEVPPVLLQSPFGGINPQIRPLPPSPLTPSLGAATWGRFGHHPRYASVSPPLWGQGWPGSALFPPQRSARPSRCSTGTATASSPSRSWARPCAHWATCPTRWSSRSSSSASTWTVGTPVGWDGTPRATPQQSRAVAQGQSLPHPHPSHHRGIV